MSTKKRSVKLNKGAQQAYGQMLDRYGQEKGPSVFFARADAFYPGRTLTPSQKANRSFGHGKQPSKRNR